MFKNHLKIAWRNLRSNPLFSILNILGLSLGLAISVVLFLFIRHEQSFDSMYPNKDRIERVLLHTDGGSGSEVWARAPSALAPEIMKDVPDVAYAARMLKHDYGDPASIRANQENFSENELFWVDKELLDIFKIKFLKGQATSALDRPNTVVLSETTAKKYFANQDPIGKTIVVGGRDELEITGIYEDFPENSTLSCDLMAAFSTLRFSKKPSWDNASFETYCLLKPNTAIASAEAQINQVLDKNIEKENQWYSFSLQPLERIHLYSEGILNSYASRMGDIKEIRYLSLLAILILLIACINYMNLTTARSQKRSKEVAVNKTLGASFQNLIGRFYIETGLITAISIIIGVGIALMAIPLFNQIVGQNLDISSILNLDFFVTLLIVWGITTIIAGSYPAIYLSRFSPKVIFNRWHGHGKSSGYIRKGLVVFQFTASVILIIGIIVIFLQMKFIHNQKLGFDPDNVIAVSLAGMRNNENTSALKQEFKELGGVSNVSMAQGFPGKGVSGRSLFKNENDEGAYINTNHADAEIIDALKMKLLAGKTLPGNKQPDDKQVDVILNKKAIDYLGYSPQEAIGKKVLIGGLGPNVYIVGVVKDFNFESLHEAIGPYAFHNKNSEAMQYLIIRFNSTDFPTMLNEFEKTFRKVKPDAAFDYTFLDKNLEKLYEGEQKTARIGMVFCVLAIFVSCLGLFGLAAFMAEQRKKEISIRKVLGASILSITRMISKDFVKLILVALVIAFPIAFWLMDHWLQSFAYRINIGWWVFVVAGLSALVIALFTVSFQSIRAALTNPIENLRSV